MTEQQASMMGARMPFTRRWTASLGLVSLLICAVVGIAGCGGSSTSPAAEWDAQLRELVGSNVVEGLKKQPTPVIERLIEQGNEAIEEGIDAGDSVADVAPLRRTVREAEAILRARAAFDGDIGKLESGYVVRMVDINTIDKRLRAYAADGWQQGSQEWRERTAQGLRAQVAAIRAGMRAGIIR